MNKPISRRNFLRFAGGAAVLAAGASLAPQGLRKVLRPEGVAEAQTAYRRPTCSLPARTAGSACPRVQKYIRPLWAG